MTDTKHTPGPWRVNVFTYSSVISAIDGRFIAETQKNGRPAYNEDKANAQLIADAPETAAERDRLREINAELLAALKACIGTLGEVAEELEQWRKLATDDDEHYHNTVKDVDDATTIAGAAIAKAKKELSR